MLGIGIRLPLDQYFWSMSCCISNDPIDRFDWWFCKPVSSSDSEAFAPTLVMDDTAYRYRKRSLDLCIGTDLLGLLYLMSSLDLCKAEVGQGNHG